MDSIVLFGKYRGLKFDQVLAKDLNYCEWLLRIPVNDRTADFHKYLEDNIEAAKREKLKAEIKALTEKLK